MTNARIAVYEDEGGEWRWRLDVGNGKKFAVSGEGFDSKGNARRAAERLRDLLEGAEAIEGGLEIVEVERSSDVGLELGPTSREVLERQARRDDELDAADPLEVPGS